ncbi:unnamed protein product, partial [Prunus brigantina]
TRKLSQTLYAKWQLSISDCFPPELWGSSFPPRRAITATAKLTVEMNTTEKKIFDRLSAARSPFWLWEPPWSRGRMGSR